MEKDDRQVGLPTASRLSIIHDLYIDFLGSLVPGLLFVILTGTNIILAVSSIHAFFLNEPLGGGFSFGGIKEIVASFHWEIAAFILVAAYVIGAAFYRQDPKKPDLTSALRVWLHSSTNERDGLAAKPETREAPIGASPVVNGTAPSQVPPTKSLFRKYKSRFSEWLLKRTAELLQKDCPELNLALSINSPSLPIIENPEPRQEKTGRPHLLNRTLTFFFPGYCAKLLKMNVEFPYLYLKKYLVSRKLDDLAAVVTWGPEDANSKQIRSKMSVNNIKIRLLALHPEKGKITIRNEAEVRLATSSWHASKALSIFSLGIILTVLIAYSISRSSKSGTFAGFQASDIIYPDGFYTKFTQRTDPSIKWLHNQVTNSVNSKNFVPSVVEAMQAITQGSCLEQSDDLFTKIALRAETQQLLAQMKDDQGAPQVNIKRLNRLMIEDAFPEDIRRSAVWPSSLFVSISYSFILMISAFLMERHLRKFVHYMRVREVVNVLAISTLVDEESENKKVLSHVKGQPPAHSFGRTFPSAEIVVGGND